MKDIKDMNNLNNLNNLNNEKERGKDMKNVNELNNLNNLNNNEEERGNYMENIKNIINKINDVNTHTIYVEDAFYKLQELAYEYNLAEEYLEDMNYIDRDQLWDYIQIMMEDSWKDVEDLAYFMGDIRTHGEEIFRISDYGYLENVTERDLEDLRDQMIYELTQPTHVLELSWQKNDWVYGIDFELYTEYDYNQPKIFRPHKERTYSLVSAWDDAADIFEDEWDEEAEKFKDQEAYIYEAKYLEEEYLNMYIEEYLEEMKIDINKVQIVNYTDLEVYGGWKEVA